MAPTDYAPTPEPKNKGTGLEIGCTPVLLCLKPLMFKANETSRQGEGEHTACLVVNQTNSAPLSMLLCNFHASFYIDLFQNDPFSMSNLLSMGVKIALALVSNYSTGGLDRNGNEISPVEVRLREL